MNLYDFSSKDIGNYGESIVCAYLRKRGFTILDRNRAFKTGELDIVAQKGKRLHLVEVKSLASDAFPDHTYGGYKPEENLSQSKLKKVVRTAQWYIAQANWAGEWQIDAAFVWLRRSDGVGRVRYMPQVL